MCYATTGLEPYIEVGHFSVYWHTGAVLETQTINCIGFSKLFTVLESQFDNVIHVSSQKIGQIKALMLLNLYNSCSHEYQDLIMLQT